MWHHFESLQGKHHRLCLSVSDGFPCAVYAQGPENDINADRCQPTSVSGHRSCFGDSCLRCRLPLHGVYIILSCAFNMEYIFVVFYSTELPFNQSLVHLIECPTCIAVCASSLVAYLSILFLNV